MRSTITFDFESLRTAQNQSHSDSEAFFISRKEAELSHMLFRDVTIKNLYGTIYGEAIGTITFINKP